jgi:hypothetical protein
MAERTFYVKVFNDLEGIIIIEDFLREILKSVKIGIFFMLYSRF